MVGACISCRGKSSIGHGGDGIEEIRFLLSVVTLPLFGTVGGEFDDIEVKIPRTETFSPPYGDQGAVGEFCDTVPLVVVLSAKSFAPE
ncbi:hypothetical protein D1872_277130 [compost metagenome]